MLNVRAAARAALPFLLGVGAFVAIGFGVDALRHRGDDRLLDRTIHTTRAETVPLQVAVHDVVEALPAGGGVRVCRALADRPVTVDRAGDVTARVLLAMFAAQTGGTLALGVVRPGDRPLPVIECPQPSGGYLLIQR